MTIKKYGKKWIVRRFVLEHNLELLTPRSISSLHRHRGVIRSQKKLIFILNQSRVTTMKIMSVLTKNSGGDFNIDCIGKDVETSLKIKRKKLFEGDHYKKHSDANVGYVQAPIKKMMLLT